MSIQLRRDTSYYWDTNNPVLASGEQGYDLNIKKMKIGDGVSTWTSLPYMSDDTKVNLNISINNQTGTAYTLVLTDSNKYIRMNNADANTVTVPDNATTAFTIGTQIHIRQVGAGQTTIASTATINTAQTLLLGSQGSTVTLIKVDTDEWDLMGDLEAA